MPAAEFALLRVIMVRRPNLLWEEAAVQLFPLVFYKYQGRQIKDALYSRGWTRKKLHFVARERDNYLRALFCQLLHAPGQQFNARQFVFVDETLKKGQDAMRTHGVAPAGERAVAVVVKRLLAGRTSALVALSLKGVLSKTMVDTSELSVTTELFMTVLRYRILPQMNPFPADRSILFLDNARIHNKMQVYAACAAVGVRAFFLPPYSCDYMPNELLFNNSRTYMVREFGLGNHIRTIEDMFSEALENCMTPDQICNTFAFCGYPVSAVDRAWAIA